MLRWFFLLLLGLSPTVALQAQTAPPPESLLRDWATTQREAGQDLAYIAFTETITWTVDGPFGMRETELDARVQGMPEAQEWDRQIRSLRVNGTPVPEERWRGFPHQMRRLFGRNAALMAPGLPMTLRLLARTRPASGVTAEDLGAIPTWRLDVVPIDEARPVDRITLWFDRETGALRQTRTIFQSRGSTLVATVDYERRNGLDLPRVRHLEGTLQTRRRGQSFTLLFSLDATYSAYDLTFEAP